MRKAIEMNGRLLASTMMPWLLLNCWIFGITVAAEQRGSWEPLGSGEPPPGLRLHLGGDACLDFVHVPAGESPGGRPAGEVARDTDKPRHTLRLASGFYINQENAEKLPGDPQRFRRPGRFFQPSDRFIRRCLESPGFLGICYDEAEHWAMNGVFVTARKHSLTDFVPHFYDAEGDCVEAAYAGNLHNVRVLMDTVYADFARPPQPGPIVCTEHVFPVMFHLFARAGVAPLPKYLKESVTPVIAAMALGAAKQYGTPVIPCVDLWGPGADWPAHSPEALSSALLFAYWTGSPAVYVENFSYRDSLYQMRPDGTHELTAWGEAVKRFKRKTIPANPRNIQPDERTRAWIGAWRLVSHQTIPESGLTWHAGYDFPYRLFFPANNIAVYDHTAADEELYRHARLILLCGVTVTDEALETIRHRTEMGAVTVSLPWLSPPELEPACGQPFAETPLGTGAWIVTEDFRSPELRKRLAPLLGRADQLRYVFGRTEVIFRQDGAGLAVETRPIP